MQNLLPTRGSVINLINGTSMKEIPVTYNPNRGCSKIDQLMSEMMLGDEERMKCLQRLVTL